MSRGRLVRRAPFESNSLRRAVNWHLSSGWPIRFSSAAHRAGAAGAAGIVATSKLWFPIIARADDDDELLVAPRPIPQTVARKALRLRSISRESPPLMGLLGRSAAAHLGCAASRWAGSSSSER